MELLDIVDEHGNPKGETVDREVAHKQGVMHRTSHVWLVREKDGKTQILLQKRCQTKDSYPGCYDISSAGHIPAGMEFEESAIRELKEELGVSASPDELVFCGDRTITADDEFFDKEFHDRQFSRVFFLQCDLDESKFTLQKDEVECVLWMDLDECIEAVKSNSIKHCIYLCELEMVRSALIQEKMAKNNRYWSLSLFIVGFTSLIICGTKILGAQLPDLATRVFGVIELIACPALVYTSLKKFKKQ